MIERTKYLSKNLTFVFNDQWRSLKKLATKNRSIWRVTSE